MPFLRLRINAWTGSCTRNASLIPLIENLLEHALDLILWKQGYSITRNTCNYRHTWSHSTDWVLLVNLSVFRRAFRDYIIIKRIMWDDRRLIFKIILWWNFFSQQLFQFHIILRTWSATRSPWPEGFFMAGYAFRSMVGGSGQTGTTPISCTKFLNSAISDVNSLWLFFYFRYILNKRDRQRPLALEVFKWWIREVVKRSFSHICKRKGGSITSVNFPVWSLDTSDLSFTQGMIVENKQHPLVSHTEFKLPTSHQCWLSVGIQFWLILRFCSVKHQLT